MPTESTAANQSCAHEHPCAHEHHHHGAGCSHGIEPDALSAQKVTRLLWVSALVLGFAIAECLVGYLSHSVALFADSGHLAADCLAVLMALGAAWWVKRGTDKPVQAIAALINGLVLVAIAIWIGLEALEALQSPPIEILGKPMLITACVGLVVNGINFKLLHDHSHDDLNVKGVLLHVMADAASSLGILVAAIAISVFNWRWADGAVSLFVAALILASAVPLVYASLQQLNGLPEHANPLPDESC